MEAGAPIRVAMVHGPGRPDHDGVSDYVQRLARALQTVHVTAAPVRLNPSIEGWLRAARRIRRSRPDLVHLHFAPSAYRFSAVPGLLPPLLPPRTPLVTTVHEYGWWAVPEWVPERLWRLVEGARLWDREAGRLVLSSAAVIATNPAHAEQVRARTGKDVVQVPLAPNVDDRGAVPGARQRVRQRFGLAPQTQVLCFFGFVHPVKGLRFLIEALPSMRAHRPHLHLLVVGGFASQALPEHEARAFRQELEELARRYGVRDAVTFTGYLPAAHVSKLLHGCDLAVLPFTEGVTTKSGALLAALAHGLPAAVTVADEPDERLRDGETVAAIANRRDSAAIARTVGKLLDDEALRRRVSAGGRRLADGYTWPAVAAAHRAVYEKVRHGT